MDWNSVLALALSLTGFAAFTTMLVNVLKLIKVKGNPLVKDGDAPKWTAGITLVGVIALYTTKLFLPTFDPTGIDKIFLEIATIGTYITSFVVTVGLEKLFHIFVKGAPVVGTSYTYNRQLAELKQNG